MDALSRTDYQTNLMKVDVVQFGFEKEIVDCCHCGIVAYYDRAKQITTDHHHHPPLLPPPQHQLQAPKAGSNSWSASDSGWIFFVNNFNDFSP